MSPNPEQYQVIHDMFAALPSRTRNPSIIEYAETTIIPTGPFRGLKFDKRRGPYLTEIMECLSPSSPYREVVVMFPAQSGKTFTADTLAMYYIEAVPSEIIYATSDETAATKWLEREIVPRAANAGIVFKMEVDNRSSRRTGNTTYSKTFPGGNIDIASALSPAQLASATKRIVLADEVDRWKIKLGDQGSVVNQLRARAQAWKNQAKIFWFSTPTTEDASVIFTLYRQGDQREYFVPCPYCGTLQQLDFLEGRGYGLTWERKGGHIYKRSIEFICESKTCGRGIREAQKPKMLIGGEWRPSAVPEYEHMVSFNINGLYSFQLSWYDMIVGYEEAKTDPVKKQDFDMLKMARPHKPKGARPSIKKVMENQGTYRAGEVPNDVLYLTAGVDVQRGSADDPNNPPRLELQIIGTGYAKRYWSILYKRFEGDITNPYGGAWEDMHEWALESGLVLHRRADGFGFPVALVFIDSGDGEETDIVYSFCQRWQNTFPIKGRRDVVKRAKDKPDEMLQGNMQRYRPSKIGEDIIIYLINTNYYKTQIYHSLSIPRQDTYPQRPGFIEFPSDYDERFFDGLTAEDRMADGSFDSRGRRNEPLDTFVYGLCAADVFLDSEVQTYKGWAKNNGANPVQIQKINHRYVIDEMIKQTAIKKIVDGTRKK